MCDCCKECIQEVAVEAVTASDTIALPYSERVQSATIRRILVRRSGSATLKSYTLKTLAADTVIATAHLVLMNKNGAEQMRYPVSALQRDFNSPDAYTCNFQDIDLTQCSIKLDTGASGYSATAVIEIIFGIECPTTC